MDSHRHDRQFTTTAKIVQKKAKPCKVFKTFFFQRTIPESGSLLPQRFKASTPAAIPDLISRFTNFPT